jgi:hypothetical protein
MSQAGLRDEEAIKNGIKRAEFVKKGELRNLRNFFPCFGWEEKEQH